MNLYIFRHASTFASNLNIPYGSKVHSAEILPDGIPATERLAMYLDNIETEANFASPFLRCRQTVAIVEKITNKIFTYDERLGEYIEGIMSFPKFRKRIKDFIAELESKNYQNISICTHGGVIAGLKHLIINHSYHIWNLTDYPVPGVLTIIKEGKVDEIDFR